MKVGSKQPPAPPPEFTLTFSQHEGWALVAALRHWAYTNPEAADVQRWRDWATLLDKELRR